MGSIGDVERRFDILFDQQSRGSCAFMARNRWPAVP